MAAATVNLSAGAPKGTLGMMTVPKTLADTAELVAVDTLTVHPDNPRRGNIDRIAESVRRNGFYGALIVQTSTRRIVAGNHRYLAARKLGYTHLPVMYVDVDDPTAERILLADNRTGDLATYDTATLAELLTRFRADPAGTAWSAGDIDRLVARHTPTVADDTIPSSAEPRTQPGDLWTLGRHRLYCGDTANPTSYTHLDRPARMLLADPPYGVDYTGGSTNDRARTDRFDDRPHDLTATLTLAHRHTDQHTAAHLWFATRQLDPLLPAVTAAGWTRREIVVWRKLKPHFGALGAQYKIAFEPFLYCHKAGATPRWHGPTNETTVWEHDQPRRNDLHPTQKPVALYQRAIRNHTEPDDVILDLYSGSGTALIAAETTGRTAYAIELDPTFCDVIVTRWETATGQAATR